MNNFYVYIHMDEDFNVRYVGKGHGIRAFNKNKRSNWWKRIFKKHTLIVDFVAINLSEQESFDLEIEMIKVYREDGHKLCNMTEGGEGCSGRKCSEETKKKMSESAKGENNGFYGKKHSDKTKNKFKKRKPSCETKKKIADALRGHKMSEKTRQGLKDSNTGRKHTEESKNKISDGNRGKKRSEEHKKKISENSKGRKHTEESKNKMSELAKGENNSSAKLKEKDVLEIRRLLEMEVLQKDIAKIYNITPSTLTNIKKRKTWKHI